MSRAEMRSLRSQTVAAARRSEAGTPQELARVEWDMARARVKRIRDPAGRDKGWGQLAALLSGFGHT